MVKYKHYHWWTRCPVTGGLCPLLCFQCMVPCSTVRRTDFVIAVKYEHYHWWTEVYGALTCHIPETCMVNLREKSIMSLLSIVAAI